MWEVKFEAFQEFIAEGLAELDREWRKGRLEDPALFSERMALEDWWSHFSKIIIADRLVGGGSEPQQSEESGHFAREIARTVPH